MIGSVLNARYRILGKLGEGGMGEVYLAEHTSLGREEALKILQPAVAADPLFVSRFRREARAANRAQHSNIVGVYDFGQLPDGRFYLAMELVRGDRLDAVLRRTGPLPVPRALHILGQLVDAVDHAHSRGVVHRDLKPTNLILTEHRGHPDFVKVLDFGIAKIIAPDVAESLGLTRQGEIFGTPEYMAPELCRGIGTDPRSDLYAIGCIAFELLVGEPPFRGAPLEILNAHACEPPDRPSARRPEQRIPAQLDEVVLRCLEKEPDRRYATGRELRVAIEAVPGFPTRQASGRRNRHGVPPLVTTAEVGHDPTNRFRVESLADALTGPIALDEARDEYHAALQELAEVLLDLGFSDLPLVMALGTIQELLDDLSRNEAEMLGLEQRSSELDQAAREREASLRFALGELTFERAQAGGRGELAGDEIERRIDELEHRLARMAQEHTRAEGALTDRAITLAAANADLADRIAAQYAALHDLVAAPAGRCATNRRVAALTDRVGSAREIMYATRRA